MHIFAYCNLQVWDTNECCIAKWAELITEQCHVLVNRLHKMKIQCKNPKHQKKHTTPDLYSLPDAPVCFSTNHPIPAQYRTVYSKYPENLCPVVEYHQLQLETVLIHIIVCTVYYQLQPEATVICIIICQVYY